MLVKKGHEVTVYTSDTLDEFQRIEDDIAHYDGINVHYFKNLSNRLAWHRFVLNPGVISALRRNLRDYDVIHLHGYRNFQNIFVHYYAEKYNVPYILQARGSLPYHNQKSLIKKSFDFLFGNRLLRDAKKVIALTKMEVDQYINLGVPETNIELIPNGIDFSEYQCLPQKGHFRRRFGIHNKEKIVLFLGRIHEIKGIDLLIDAFSLIMKEFTDVKLVIAGPDDGYLSIIKNQIDTLRIHDKVLFTGPLYAQDKITAYVDADIYVLPSRYEVFGNTILEAYACGTPVIVTDRCGISDFVKNVGFVVQFDKNELRDAILAILKDRDLRVRLGLEGKELVKKQFDLNQIIACFEEVYKNEAHSSI
ncbi:glycosyltransferase [Syntrophaceticus schinkii]|uniref:Glycosyl transferase group 1 n=1 Tax=Syntrophaceticus schinkii TaxID=499207 RepID=A0A0B7MBX8_9FIRM|nr:glycosyltransferase [Syntrophaceticus schinkii]CEO88034.1 Glycosyl transferase group 1 [Syntrophaceticus schinkii]